MLDELKQLYLDSGFWAQPILLSTLALIVAWTIMMFTVRMIKRFIIFSIIAFLLPNGLGLVGYIEKAGDVKEAIVERGEEISGELRKPLEDIEFSPLYLGLIGSAVTVVLGVAGIARVHRKNRSQEKSREETAK
jgi:hypothetical protein